MDQTHDMYGMYDGTRRELVAAELGHDVGSSISLFDVVNYYLWRRGPRGRLNHHPCTYRGVGHKI
jgi:hypothetical protein